MQSLSETTSRLTKQTLGRKYVALGRIVAHWTDIVGTQLASHTTPAKIHYRQYKNQKRTKKAPEVTLEIATTPSHATRLHYQKDLILERLNQVFGERWITDLKFVTISSNKNTRPKQQKKRIISEKEKKDLANMLDLIEDPDIKERLRNLGTSILEDDS